MGHTVKKTGKSIECSDFLNDHRYSLTVHSCLRFFLPKVKMQGKGASRSSLIKNLVE